MEPEAYCWRFISSLIGRGSLNPETQFMKFWITVK